MIGYFLHARCYANIKWLAHKIQTLLSCNPQQHKCDTGFVIVPLGTRDGGVSTSEGTMKVQGSGRN